MGQTVNKCLDCKHYNQFDYECDAKDTHNYCFNDDNVTCNMYQQREKCDHRYEDCSCNTECSILCHDMPSKRGCKFYYCCKLDERVCDNNCEKHFKHYELEKTKERLKNLETAYKVLGNLIDECKAKIKELQ